MTTLKYLDYQGSVVFEDGRLVIQILHIQDTITTIIDSAPEAQAAFEELVKDYVSTCEELAKEPCKPFKGTFNVRVAPDLHRHVAMAAAETGETMNAWIQVALENHVDRQQHKKALLDRSFVVRAFEARSSGLEYKRHESLSYSANSNQQLFPSALKRQLVN